MNAGEIRNLNEEQIIKKLDESRNELFKLKIQVSTQQLTKVSEIKRVRRLIARLNTVYNEKLHKARS